MNTAVQIKTHTNKSASKKNVHILRESESYQNVNIEVLQKTSNYKFQDDVTPPVARADIKSEKQRQAELRKTNNKINTYKKRLEVFKEQKNTKKVESLTKQIEELKKEKEHLKQSKTAPETRGKKRTQNYVEFELSLTNSNQWLKDKKMQEVLKKAVQRMLKTKIIKQLTPITQVLHLDQHSLHFHLLTRLPKNKTWDDILKSDFKPNPKKSDLENQKLMNQQGRKVYKNIQDTFQKLIKEEIIKANFKNVSSLTSFTHRKGVKYLPLSKYKQLNPILDTKKQIKEPTASKIDFKKLLDGVDKKVKATVNTVEDNSLYELENDFDFEKMSKDAKTTQKAVFEEKPKTTRENDSSLLTKNNPDNKKHKKSRSK